MKVDYPYTLALHIIQIRTGVKSSWNNQYSKEKERWHDWAEKFINSKTRTIAILIKSL